MFITPENWHIILPQSHMTQEEKLNALVRFFTYLSVILAIANGQGSYLFLAIIAGAVTIVIEEFQKKKQVQMEKYLEAKSLDIVDESICVRPTVDNPFMNVLQSDYDEAAKRPQACNVLNEKIQERVENNFNKKIFRDSSDIYNKMSSQREFYTMPNTTIPNDQESFAEFLYGTGPTCKEGSLTQCFSNLHVQIGQS